MTDSLLYLRYNVYNFFKGDMSLQKKSYCTARAYYRYILRHVHKYIYAYTCLNDMLHLLLR